MITRPLDLASKLRPAPRSLDCVFYVNAGLIALFFVLFGSRYVLSPGLGASFELPTVPGAEANTRLTTHVITVVNAGQIFVDDGVRNIDQLQSWLTTRVKTEKSPVLLVRGTAGVPLATLARIGAMASGAGFMVTIAAQDAASVGPTETR